MQELAQVAVSGLLIGLVYALIAAGLTLMFGVMDIVNFAHGDMLMVAMYGVVAAWAASGVDPLAALPGITAIMFVFGAAFYWLLLRRILSGDLYAQIFATFGLGLFLRGAAHLIFGTEPRSVEDPFTAGRDIVAGIALPRAQIVAGVGALVAVGALHWLVFHTRLGRHIRAVAEDRQAATLIGINPHRVYVLVCGAGVAAVGLAAALLANFYSVYPEVGNVFVLTIFVVVALGGFGSITGALVAAVLVGLVQNLSGYLIAPAWKDVVVYGMYIVIVAIRPQGLFGTQ